MDKEILKPNFINVGLTAIINAILWFLPIVSTEAVMDCMGCGSETFYRSVYDYLFEFVIRDEMLVLISLAIFISATYLLSSFIAYKLKTR